MCIVEQKMYPYTDGSQRIVDTIRYCRDSRDSKICKNVERRSIHANVVEVRPSTATTAGPSNDGYIVTQGLNGRSRTYRDISNRSSNSSSRRRSNTFSEKSPVSIPSSASSPPVIESRPTPPETAPGSPSIERRRAPYPSPSSEPSRIIRADGTAVYDRPPSLEMPRATENERSTASRPRRLSASSTTAEVDDSQLPSTAPRRRRTVRISTEDREAPTTTPITRSPRLSNLPNLRDTVRDAANNQPPRRRDSRIVDPPSTDAARRFEEDQARLERDRIAASNARQAAREEAARGERERHRQAAAEALEGRSQPRPREPPRTTSPTANRSASSYAQAEYDQMARERAAAEVRRRQRRDSAAQRHAEDMLRRDAEGWQQHYSARQTSPTSVRPPSRRGTGEQFSYSYTTVTSEPTSPRVERERERSVRVHQYYYPSAAASGSASGPSSRRRAEQATENLNAAMGGLSIDVDLERDREGRWEYVWDDGEDGYVPVEEVVGGRRRRRYR